MWLKLLDTTQHVAQGLGAFALAIVLVAASIAVTAKLFWNGIALPAGSFVHTVLLDNVFDAFHSGACKFTSSVAACLHRVAHGC